MSRILIGDPGSTAPPPVETLLCAHARKFARRSANRPPIFGHGSRICEKERHFWLRPVRCVGAESSLRHCFKREGGAELVYVATVLQALENVETSPGRAIASSIGNDNSTFEIEHGLAGNGNSLAAVPAEELAPSFGDLKRMEVLLAQHSRPVGDEHAVR